MATAHAEAQRRHYLSHRSYYRNRNRLKRQQLTEFIRQAKEGKPCADCGKLYPPYVMDFDHRDPSTKTAIISYLPRLQSWARLKAELAKCDLVCANCHRMRTFGAPETRARQGPSESQLSS